MCIRDSVLTHRLLEEEVRLVGHEILPPQRAVVLVEWLALAGCRGSRVRQYDVPAAEARAGAGRPNELRTIREIVFRALGDEEPGGGPLGRHSERYDVWKRVAVNFPARATAVE